MRTLCFLLLAGCGGASLAQLQERDRCYERAESVAQERIDRECPGAFASCASADDILKELRTSQEACP